MTNLAKRIEELTLENKILKEKYLLLKIAKKKNEMDLSNHINKLTKQIKVEHFVEDLEENIVNKDFGKNLKNYLESETGLTLDARNRSRQLIYLRCIYYKLMRKYSSESLVNIGLLAGNLHYATVINGLNIAQDLIDTDKQFVLTLNKYEQYVRENLIKIDELTDIKAKWERNIFNTPVSLYDSKGNHFQDFDTEILCSAYLDVTVTAICNTLSRKRRTCKGYTIIPLLKIAE